MFFKRKSRLAVGDINKLVEEKCDIDDSIAKVQREKDLKVDTINKKYESKIDTLVRKQKEVEILLENSKKYIENV